MIRVSDQMGDERLGSMRVNIASLIDKLLDELAICDDDSRIPESLQRKDTTILLCPFEEPVNRDVRAHDLMTGFCEAIILEMRIGFGYL